MTGTRYRSFTKSQFDALMNEMRFAEVKTTALEHVYQRVVHNGPKPSDRFAIRLYSTVDVRTGVARDNGGDAIRVMLFDTQRDKPVQDWTVNRTQNAFTNVKARCRDAWGYVMDATHHCDCGSLMVERTSKRGAFLGCTSFPECKATKPLAKAA